MKVILFDKTEIIVSKDDYQRIIQALQKPNLEWITIKGMPYRPRAIAYFKDGGLTEVDMPRDNQMLTARAGMTDEQRLKNRRTIARIRADFLKRKLTKGNKYENTKRPR